ncbi:MAG: hypothetical protein OEU32_00290 [Acidimicrobiia bacterium]|nr:hypothetical protein [Acidimicrobiia bacterium]
MSPTNDSPTTARSRPRLFGLIAALLLLAGACASDGVTIAADPSVDPSAGSSAPPDEAVTDDRSPDSDLAPRDREAAEDEPAEAATEEPAIDEPATEEPAIDEPAIEQAPTAPTLPATTVFAPLETTYDFAGGPPAPGTLPIAPGEVTARWYVEGDHYVVHYDGLDPGIPSCPGNSIQTTGGFESVSNASLAGLDCSALSTAVENSTSQGVAVCGDMVFYRTLIPADRTGTLFGSFEIVDADLNGVGATSMSPTAPGAAPEIDLAELGC